MYQNDPMKVLTGECRLSYCNLTTPRAAQQGGEPKYSVTLLIPKTDVATKADIDAAIQAAANELTHAFLYESGLSVNGMSPESWPTNEEMVDWMAIQGPKLYDAWKRAGCL